MWFAAFLGNEVVWSGHRFAVQKTGEMVDLTETVPVAEGEPRPEAPSGGGRRAAPPLRPPHPQPQSGSKLPHSKATALQKRGHWLGGP